MPLWLDGAASSVVSLLEDQVADGVKAPAQVAKVCNVYRPL